MYATDFTQVGHNIQTILHEKGMTQQQLSEQLSISKQVMSKIINGAKAINVTEIARIASVLGTTTDFLLSLHFDQPTDEALRFMGAIDDEDTKHKVNLIRVAIDQICFLEGIIND